MKTYEIKYNGFGNCYVIAPNISTAEQMFIKAGYGGENVEIKSITSLVQHAEPLTPSSL